MGVKHYGLRSIVVRTMAVVLAAAFASGGIALYVASRAMSDTAEVKLVEAMTADVDRARTAIASRLDVAEAQLTAAALLADGERIHDAPIALSEFICATRVISGDEVLELVRHEEARPLIPTSEDNRRGRWLAGEHVVVRVEVGSSIASGVVEITSLFPADDGSTTLLDSVDERLDVAGIIVTRDPDHATARGSLGGSLILRHEISLVPARADVRAQLERTVGWSVGVTLILVLVIAWVLARWVTHPIRGLAAAVANGREQLVLPALQNDEIGELGSAIASMHRTLAHDARLLAVGAELAHDVVRLQEPDAVLQRLALSLETAHPDHDWRVFVGEAAPPAIASARDANGEAAIVIRLFDGDTEVGVAIGTGHPTEAELRSVEVLCHTGFAAIKAIGLLRAAAVNDKLALLGRMSAGIAHEINNPLAFVTVNLGLLEEQLTGEAHELVREATMGVERVARIVRDLSQLSRSGSEALERENLVGIVEEQVKIAKARLGSVKLVFEPTGAVDVMCSRARVGQAVLNLIINAIDAVASRPDGRVEVNVTRDGDRASVVVRDNGPGIPSHVRNHLFDAFFSTKGDRGTGLGLYLSRKFIELQGGQLEVLDTGESGTTFRIELAKAPEPAAIVDEEAVAMGSGPVRRRVLVIDDEPQITRTLQRWLSKFADVVTANTAREGLEKLHQSYFALVLCDLNMPGMSGVDFVAAVRESRPECLDRVVIMTGGTGEGVHDVRLMHKPLDRDAIRELLGV